MTEEEIAMMQAMGLPVGFGAVKKDNSASQLAKAMNDTKRAVVEPTLPAAKTESKPEGNVGMDITVKPAAGAGTGAGVEKAKIESQGGAKTGLARYADDSDDDDDDDDDGAGSEDEAAHDADELPISHQAALKDHQRTVSALSIDPSGSRFVTGGRDCMFKLWDFHGMDASLKPFRSFEATSGNPIRDVQFSPSGDQILMASSSAQPKVYDRDGVEIVEFVKGDPYIRDMRHTKGHVAALTACRWHPFEKSTFLTASLDSTIRIWDVTSKRSHKQVIAVKSKQPGGKTAITAAAYSHDGKLIAGGGQDGALRIWNSNGNFLAPSHNVENAHMPGAPITSLTFSRNTPSPLLATRAMDDTLKLWDLRSLRQPLHTVPNLPNFFEETDVTFSPNDRYILTGTSVKKDQGFGTLCVFDRDSLKEVANVQVATSSVVRVAWHPKINQIVLGTGDGSVQVMYDPVLSLAGIKAALGKVPKKRGEFAVFADDAHRPIINPHALAMYRDDALNASRSTKRKIEKLRADPIATRKPDMPLMTGPGRGGKVGTNVTQHIMKGLIKDDSRSQDPREAFLKHAKEAEEKPFWVAPAYTKNQPKPVHAESVYEDEGEAARAAAKKRRQ